MNDTELERLIDNNISNAIKHSNKGSQIKIRLENYGETTALRFISQGKEIHDASKIFNKNYTEIQSAQRSLGLGLNMVKNICDKNQIEYHVQSQNDTNTFTYILKD